MANLDFSLPWAPSSNRYWRTSRQGVVYVSDEAKNYRIRAALSLNEQRVPRASISGPLGLDIFAHAPDGRRYDVSNRIKVLEDLLERHGVIENDGCFDDVRIRRGVPVPGGLMWVTIYLIEGAAIGT